MIKIDQPTIFGSDIIASVSSTDDGDMRFSGGDVVKTARNRALFLSGVGISEEQTTRVQVTYENVERFTRYSVVKSKDKSLGMKGDNSNLIADGLVVKEAGHGLFLLIADCVGVILYDPIRQCLMVSHIGRHSAQQEGGAKSVQFLVEECESNPSDIKVWLSPAAGKVSYPIHAMEDRGLHEVIQEQLRSAGILPKNIETSDIDTTTSKDYFSHSRFLRGESNQIDGRFAIVAMIP